MQAVLYHLHVRRGRFDPAGGRLRCFARCIPPTRTCPLHRTLPVWARPGTTCGSISGAPWRRGWTHRGAAGRPPRGEAEFRPAEGGLSYAEELVALIREEFPGLGVIVAGYPETHPGEPPPRPGLGASEAQGGCRCGRHHPQLFYDNGDYFRFRDRCEAAGITVPVVPGLLPVTNLTQIKRITGMCGTHLTQKLVQPAGGAWGR